VRVGRERFSVGRVSIIHEHDEPKVMRRGIHGVPIPQDDDR
jgi:hypothetical protein